MIPRKALVLAAGLGTRLRPLTTGIPKPLLPLWNIPMIERTLRFLEDVGVEEIIVNLHWGTEQLKRYLGKRKGPATIVLSEEKEILGTGGALRPIQNRLQNGPFWIINADVAFSLDPRYLLTYFDEGDPFAVTWLMPDQGPCTVEMDYANRITSYASLEPGIPGTSTFCGMSIVSPQIFKYLPKDRPFCTLIELFEAAMMDNLFVRGVVIPDSYWADTGTMERYLTVHADAKKRARRGVHGEGLYQKTADRLPPDDTHFFCVGLRAHIDPLVKGKDSVVLGDAEIIHGSKLDHAIVSGGMIGIPLSNCICVSLPSLKEPALSLLAKELKWPEEKVGVIQLGTRGSNRTFWRMIYQKDSVIAISYTDERVENTRYAGHARILSKAGVPVPQVRADLPEAHCQAWEDLGDDSLQKRMNESPDRALYWYKSVLQKVAMLHKTVAPLVLQEKTSLEPAFDADLYQWERNLFETYLLKDRYGYDELPPKVEKELKRVSEILEKQPQVIVHRDLQSSNILFRDDVEPVLIDFQGMRFGAAAYDLASLLFDPYVEISEDTRKDLWMTYQKEFPEGEGITEENLYFGAVQRLVQALGAYGRLASVGQPGFTKHIARGLDLLLEAADFCDLDALGSLCEDLIYREKMRRDSSR